MARCLGEKSGDDVRLWDSGTSAAKDALGWIDGGRGLIDTLHDAASVSRAGSLWQRKRRSIDGTGVS